MSNMKMNNFKMIGKILDTSLLTDNERVIALCTILVKKLDENVKTGRKTVNDYLKNIDLVNVETLRTIYSYMRKANTTSTMQMTFFDFTMCLAALRSKGVVRSRTVIEKIENVLKLLIMEG